MIGFLFSISAIPLSAPVVLPTRPLPILYFVVLPSELHFLVQRQRYHTSSSSSSSPLTDTLREHHLHARWRHPMLPNLKLNLNLNLNLLVILLTHHSYLSPPNYIIIKALEKILTVDAEIEGGRLPESWFESTLDRSIDPTDDSFCIHAMSPSEGTLTKLREALLVGRGVTCNAALRHIDLPSKAIRMDDWCYALLCGRITALRAQYICDEYNIGCSFYS
ncbi:hypothetical protein DFH09DRAFT_1302057 [Mycena vulgaris]|nr:hypothetical protein DFH09DRAFT_1302057 [Mycena vulgaris]